MITTPNRVPKQQLPGISLNGNSEHFDYYVPNELGSGLIIVRMTECCLKWFTPWLQLHTEYPNNKKLPQDEKIVYMLGTFWLLGEVKPRIQKFRSSNHALPCNMGVKSQIPWYSPRRRSQRISIYEQSERLMFPLVQDLRTLDTRDWSSSEWQMLFKVILTIWQLRNETMMHIRLHR